MKIAISSVGKGVEDAVSDVFARCPCFVIVELKDGKILNIKALENKSAEQLGQAGISVAQLMAEEDVNVVISKNVGPRAFDALNQFNIDIYSGEGVIKDVLQKFIEGKLEKIKNENSGSDEQ